MPGEDLDRGELRELAGKVAESGVYRHVETMLWDMVDGDEEEI